MSTKTLGAMGEESAALYLSKNGYTVLGRNVRLGYLEVDIIAASETHLIFVEVKTRRGYPGTGNRYGRPCDAVDAKKRERLRRAVKLWRVQNPGAYADLIPNIDIIEVYADPSPLQYRVLDLRHYRNAVNGMKGI